MVTSSKPKKGDSRDNRDKMRTCPAWPCGTGTGTYVVPVPHVTAGLFRMESGKSSVPHPSPFLAAKQTTTTEPRTDDHAGEPADEIGSERAVAEATRQGVLRMETAR